MELRYMLLLVLFLFDFENKLNQPGLNWLALVGAGWS